MNERLQNITITDEIIRTKWQCCKIFHHFICVLGILVPLLYFLAIFIYPFAVARFLSLPITDSKILMPIDDLLVFVLWAVLLLVAALLLPFWAMGHYTKDRKDNEKYGDWILYFCGFITIVLIALIVYWTGGINHSLMSFYFFFIPAAIAIVFNGRKGLLITGICCMVSIVILFGFCNSTEIHYDPIHRCVFSVYQLFLILLVEWRKHKPNPN